MLKNFFSKIAQKVKKSLGFEKKMVQKPRKKPKTVSHRFKVFFCDEGYEEVQHPNRWLTNG